jgi:hypothetical protein
VGSGPGLSSLTICVIPHRVREVARTHAREHIFFSVVFPHGQVLPTMKRLFPRRRSFASTPTLLFFCFYFFTPVSFLTIPPRRWRWQRRRFFRLFQLLFLVHPRRFFLRFFSRALAAPGFAFTAETRLFRKVQANA